MQNEIMVSVCCVTYNHAKYISEAIDSFLMQKTDFPFEIILHDDASTDGTTDIILKYQKQYPGVIKSIIQSENQWSKGKRITPIVIGEAKGKYIALCEGDDYWTDPKKLQKQVEFMENIQECTLLFTNRIEIDPTGNIIKDGNYEEKVYTTSDILEGFIPPTQTILFRKIDGIAQFYHRHIKVLSGDRLLSYYCSLFGNIRMLPLKSAAYRHSGEGVWNSYSRNLQFFISLERFIEFYIEMGFSVSNERIHQRINGAMIYLIKNDPKGIVHHLRRVKQIKKKYGIKSHFLGYVFSKIF